MGSCCPLVAYIVNWTLALVGLIKPLCDVVGIIYSERIDRGLSGQSVVSGYAYMV